jgi:nitrite reductase (NADH) small subunit
MPLAKRRAEETYLAEGEEVTSHKVCRLDDILPNCGVCALVEGEQVAVFRLEDDRVFALGNRDPFSGASVLSRGIVGDLKGEPVVASPLYKQHFSLLTGRCVEDPAVTVPVYAASVRGADVLIEANAADTPQTNGEN